MNHVAVSPDCGFHLKGSMVTVMVLELYGDVTATFDEQLAATVEQAPQLLRQSPVVLNLEKYTGPAGPAELANLLSACRHQGLQPIGFRGPALLAEAIAATGLALLPASSGRGRAAREPRAADRAGESASKIVPETQSPRRSKLVTQPVRSGQQVYARDADLIVMAPVSEGAEILADGNIHIYGGLRGRALAGVQGDTAARIFCQQMEAQLLSVAGNFILSEDMRDDLRKQPVQVYLDGEKLCMEPL